VGIPFATSRTYAADAAEYWARDLPVPSRAALSKRNSNAGPGQPSAELIDNLLCRKAALAAWGSVTATLETYLSYIRPRCARSRYHRAQDATRSSHGRARKAPTS
jgi:hypothetical protein